MLRWGVGVTYDCTHIPRHTVAMLISEMLGIRVIAEIIVNA